jgi:predicted metal-binding protein
MVDQKRIDLDQLVRKSRQLGASDARIISTEQIYFDPRSFLKCRFGCARWGKFWTCPPNLDMTPERFMQAFEKYNRAIIIKSADPKTGQDVCLAIEKEAMLSFGCHYAFALVLCVQCEACAFPDPCRYPHLARPSMDAYGIDFGKTLDPLGFKVEFDQAGKLLPSWYGMVLLD